MNLCLVLLSSTAYDRLLRSPVSCAHLRVTFAAFFQFLFTKINYYFV